jgi:hypothetical protein
LKIISLPYIPELLVKGVLFYDEQRHDFHFYNYAHRIIFDDKETVAVIVIREDNRGKKFYDNEFIMAKKENDGLDYSSARSNKAGQLTHHSSMGSILQSILSVNSSSKSF